MSEEIRRGRRKTRQGVVASNRMEKTCIVTLERAYQHPLYGKIVRKTRGVKAHDTLGCDIGDKVEIMETRPLSKHKRWRIVRIIEKVK